MIRRVPLDVSRRSLLAAACTLGVWRHELASASRRDASPAAAAPAWQTAAPLPAAGSEFAAALIGTSVFVAGGFGMEQRMFRLEIETNSWSEAAPLPAPRHHVGLAAWNDAMYLAGGFDAAHAAVDTLWRYDANADEWEDLPPLVQGARGALGATAIDGRIYTVGGVTQGMGGPAIADAARFEIASGEWEMLDPMPTAREHLAVAQADGLVIAIGGRNGLDVDLRMAGATEAFDPATGSWEQRAPLPVPRSGMGVATSGDAVYVLGGEGANGVYDDVDRYDPSTDTWEALPRLPIGRHGMAASVVDGTLMAIGGSTLAWDIRNVTDVDTLTLEQP